MAAVVRSCVIAEGVYVGPWVPALGQTILIAHSAGAWTSVKLNFLSGASSHLVGLGSSTASPPGIYVSPGLEQKSVIWGSLHNSGTLAESFFRWEDCLQLLFSTFWK